VTRRQVGPAQAVGKLAAPPSKSYTHRALVVARLAQRPFEVRHPLDADDTRATRAGLVALGSTVAARPGRWTVRPSADSARRRRTPVIRCGESGTTFRLLTALAAREDRAVRFEGAPPLARRPIGALVETLERAGVSVHRPRRASLPLEVHGPLRPGRFVVDGSVSSQFVSALLLVLPSLAGPSRLRVTGRAVSTTYIDATLAVLRASGIRISGGRAGWTIPGDQPFVGRAFTVPGDASSAAYLWAAAAVTGGRVTVTGLPVRWPQADRAIVPVLRDAGATTRESGDAVEVRGPMARGVDVDLTSAPDLYPLLGAVAATIPARSVLRGATHVVFKESDRRAATVRLVHAIGGTTEDRAGGLVIRGAERPRPLRLIGERDHRTVMAAAVAALAADRPSTLGDADAVRKSYPGFWSDLARLGPEVRTLP
jgi:3-phosphoshikimate 1-carboxyvinyltransferase